VIRYTVTSGVPTQEELLALEEALKHREKPPTEKKQSSWAVPQLRSPLPRKV
jgi:hypothetical protein